MNETKNNTPFSATDMESNIKHASTGKKCTLPLDSPCCLHLHSRRHRLADSDGISGKAVIDGLVNAKVLQDDRPDYVQRVTYSQEKIPKTENEETIITIEVL